MQDENVALLRKVLKKLGQLEVVKLLPMLVSKGLGKGELVAELVGVMGVWVEDAAGREFADIELIKEIVVSGNVCVGIEVERDKLTVVVMEIAFVELGVPSNRSPFCRTSSTGGLTRGAGRLSTRISPLRANWANSDLLRC